jgi:hypothetical protein
LEHSNGAGTIVLKHWHGAQDEPVLYQIFKTFYIGTFEVRTKGTLVKYERNERNEQRRVKCEQSRVLIKNIQNKLKQPKAFPIIITLHKYGKFRQF